MSARRRARLHHSPNGDGIEDVRLPTSSAAHTSAPCHVAAGVLAIASCLRRDWPPAGAQDQTRAARPRSAVSDGNARPADRHHGRRGDSKWDDDVISGDGPLKSHRDPSKRA